MAERRFGTHQIARRTELEGAQARPGVRIAVISDNRSEEFREFRGAACSEESAEHARVEKAKKDDSIVAFSLHLEESSEMPPQRSRIAVVLEDDAGRRASVRSKPIEHDPDCSGVGQDARCHGVERHTPCAVEERYAIVTSFPAEKWPKFGVRGRIENGGE